jgi:hypothetical protein
MPNSARTTRFVRSGSTSRKVLQRTLITAAAAALVAVSAGTATATPDPGTGSTVANVQVDSFIELSGLTPSFTLAGLPGDTVATGDVGQAPVVNYTVTTNNRSGYNVTVQSESPTMSGTNANIDSIPIGDLLVLPDAVDAVNTPLSGSTPVTVHSQETPSAETGDNLSSSYQMTIPFVSSDTYTATLDYVAATQ